MTVIQIVIGALDTVNNGLVQGLEDVEIRGRVETIQITELVIKIDQNMDVTEQIRVTESSQFEILFGVDFWWLGQYADKSRRNVFIIRNKGIWEKRNVF